MTRFRTRLACGTIAALVVATVSLGACSGGDADEGPDQLDRIDGPAQVDPDAEVGVSGESDG